MHRMSSKPSISYLRRVHSCMGRLQSCFPLPLHLPLAQNSPSMPTGQQGMGVPKVWTLERWSPHFLLCHQPQLFLSLWVCFSNLKNKSCMQLFFNLNFSPLYTTE
ncbi:ring-box 1, E3 ubiquitin protein ligase [Columba livia]|uniref:Ring-box 1, E3 ubiquitin protein ligase n=1 Tax=Columba livia TaxID=8932 RepID=A0A2I0MJ99_COLLI|nr:ring-box 1, E3 ubiquitin protein ligase [Columba livia]